MAINYKLRHRAFTTIDKIHAGQHAVGSNAYDRCKFVARQWQDLVPIRNRRVAERSGDFELQHALTEAAKIVKEVCRKIPERMPSDLKGARKR